MSSQQDEKKGSSYNAAQWNAAAAADEAKRRLDAGQLHERRRFSPAIAEFALLRHAHVETDLREVTGALRQLVKAIKESSNLIVHYADQAEAILEMQQSRKK